MEKAKNIFCIVILLLLSVLMVLIKEKNLELKEQKDKNSALMAQIDLQNSKINQWVKESADLQNKLNKANSDANKQLMQSKENIKVILADPIPGSCQDVIEYLANKAPELIKQ